MKTTLLLLPLALLAARPARAQEISPDLSSTGNAAQDAYDESYLLPVGGSDTFGCDGIAAYRGKYLEPVAWDELFRTFGRDDLATRYDRQMRTRSHVMTASAIGTALGLTSLTFSFVPLVGHPRPTHRDFQAALGMLIGGTVVGSLAPIGFALAPAPDVPTAAQTRRLVGEYNTELKRRFGLLSDAAPESAPAPQVAPFLLRDGGGVGVAVAFW